MIVKLIAVCFLFAALASLAGVFVGWWEARAALEKIREIQQATGLPVGLEESERVSLRPLVWMVLGALIYFAIGVYLLLSGRLLHDCLMAVPGPSSTLRTGLSEAEAAEFKAWLLQNPTMRDRELGDQVALFRDAEAAKKQEDGF